MKANHLDRSPWQSLYFGLRYDDREEYPWILFVAKTGRVVSKFRRKYVAQSEANRLDAIIVSLLE